MNRRAQADNLIIFIAFLLIIALIIAFGYQQNKQFTSVQSPAYFTVTPSNLDWGVVAWYATRQVNITNTLNQTSGYFNMTSNAPPELKLLWDFENHTIPANQTATATFTLLVNYTALNMQPNTTKPFNFTITLRG